MQLIDNQDVPASTYIEMALLQLLGGKKFEEITVKEIVKRAGISRSTFYLHYHDKYDLMDKLREEITSNFLSFYEHESVDNRNHSIVSITLSLVEHIYEYRNFYRHEFNDANYIQRLSNALAERLETVYHDKGYAIFASYGTIGYLKYWVEGEFLISAEDAAQELMNIGITDWSRIERD